MAEVAGPNPVEPIVLFTIGRTPVVYWAFAGGEDCGEKGTIRVRTLLSVFAARGFIFSLHHLQSLSAADQRSYHDTRDSCGGCNG